MQKSIIAGAGGALGSLARYGADGLLYMGMFPIMTLLINISGSFLLGLLTGFYMKRNSPVPLLLGTGFCGGFTTMSAFAAQTAELSGTSLMKALIYIALSLAGGISASMAGAAVFRKKEEPKC